MFHSERIILLFPVVIVVLSHALHQHLLMLSLLFQSPSSAFSRLLFPPSFGILFASRFQMENPLMKWHECCWLMIIIAVRIIIFISKYIYIYIKLLPLTCDMWHCHWALGQGYGRVMCFRNRVKCQTRNERIVTYAKAHIQTLSRLLPTSFWPSLAGFYDSTAHSFYFICSPLAASIFNMHIFLRWNIAQHQSSNHLYSLWNARS